MRKTNSMKRMARENTPAPGSRGLGGARKRASTATSDFGVSKREGHDSSLYYNSKMYDEVRREHDTGRSVELPSKVANSVICGDSRNLAQIPDNSVHLMVTSPPYNASKEYDEDLGLGDYLTLLRQVFAECHRVLVPGGRAVINVANLGVQSTINLSQAIRAAGTVILNGPAGVFEDNNFAFGTVEMLNACAETDAFVVIGGGHTATLI
ncbi:MAG TPA: phosphoglycerate kinase, partial [Candidatus Poseidoniales archaeon]|nr:phosphoglycerate kinase [Candidatus Poseidoniales archaeon]